MKFYKAFLFPTLLACLSLSSCYHEFPNGGGGGGGGGNNGNAFVNVTVTSTPSSTIFFPTLVFEAANISIVNSAGIPTTIAGGAGTPPLAFSQMQTNSIYLGHVTLAATNYTTLQIQYLTPFFSNFFNSTNSTVLGCASGAVCLIPNTVPGYGATTLNIPITYTPTANTNTGIRINFDLSKAVTAVGGLTFDFTQAGAITVSPLPPTATSQPTGLDTADNVTGVVTAATGTTVTVSSFADEARTFAISNTAVFEDPLNVCNGAPVNGTCIAPNQNITIDGLINSDGTRTANQIEFLDPAPAVNELEGIITSPLANGQFTMSLTNGMGSTVLIITTPVLVKLSGAETYAVDPKNLGISTSTLGFQGATDLVVGQTVMVQGGTFNGNGTSITNPTRVLLRYSSIGGLVQTPSGTTFNLAGLSSFFTNLVGNSVQVQTFQTTNYDNISNFNGLIGGTTKASVLGLYLNPTSGATQPLLAAKVRSH
jgi:hypothetical protein